MRATMKRPILGLAAACLLVVLTACSLSSGLGPTTGGVPITSAVPADGTERVVLLYTNDLHGQVEPLSRGSGQSGGLVNLVSLIDQVRAQDPERTLLLDAGDTFQGTYVSNSTQGEVVVEAMNLAGYQAWTLGNHEFDFGQETLRARIAQAHFPALAANLYDASTGRLWDAVKPYAILQAGTARVAILGLAYPNTPGITRPGNVAGLEFRPAEEIVRRVLPEALQKADLIVVLSHLGIDGDRALAQAVDGIDVIVGGHSHLAMDRPEVVNGTLIVSAGSKGQSLGRLELAVEPSTGKVTGYSRSDLLLPVTGQVSPVNEQARKLVETALAKVAATKNQPIGRTTRALEPAREGEFALGNLVVDGMRAVGVGDGVPVDVAFHNNAGIRAGLPKGQITYGQLYDVLPFDNQLIAMDLTGAQLLRILEHSVSDRPGSLQVSGLSFRFDYSEPAGQRVREVTIEEEPLDPQRTYRVVTIDFLAYGGDGFKTFLDGINLAYGDGEVWAVAEYIRSHSPVDPKVEGRIR
jgi:2',3'-cyclic-nucleotide 2'-phosphodiesterase (5'-nucleotidase family)